MPNEYCQLKVTKETNADRGVTSKQSDASPLDEKMRKAIERRVGNPGSQMSNMKRPGNVSVFDLG